MNKFVRAQRIYIINSFEKYIQHINFKFVEFNFSVGYKFTDLPLSVLFKEQ